MNHKFQYIVGSLITICFIVGVWFSANTLLKNNKILEDHMKYENKCISDSLKIIILEHRIDSLINSNLKKK